MRSHGTLNGKSQICLDFGKTGSAFRTQAASFPLPFRQLLRTGGGFAERQRDATQCQKATDPSPGFCFGRRGVIASPVATTEYRETGSALVLAVLAFSSGCCAAANRLVWCNTKMENKRQARGPVDRSTGPRHAICDRLSRYKLVLRGETNGQALCSGDLPTSTPYGVPRLVSARALIQTAA
jgi:hypothetical protein